MPKLVDFSNELLINFKNPRRPISFAPKGSPDIANAVSGGLALRSGSLALVDARTEVGLCRRTISGSAEREPRVHSTASMQKAIGSRCSTLELELVGIPQIFPPSVGKRFRFLGLTTRGNQQEFNPFSVVCADRNAYDSRAQLMSCIRRYVVFCKSKNN